MASETRPGVIVVQELSETPAAVSAPTLLPVAVGPCFQIVEALESDGSLNADAKYGDEQYNQAALAIPQADLPDPRSNIDEVNIDEEQVGVRLYFGGLLSTIARGSNGETGSSFLKGANLAAKPAFFLDYLTSSTATYDFSGAGDSGALLTLAFDLSNSSITSNDVTINFTGTMTTSEVATAINDAVGADVAEAITSGDYGIDLGNPAYVTVLVSSTGHSAASSITIRANSSACDTFLASTTFDTTKDHRIEGAGFRGEDDDDGDLVTPWIEWHRGAYKFGTAGTDLTDNSSADNAFNTTNSAKVNDFIGLIDLNSVYSGSKATDVTFTGTSPVIPLKAATATTDGDEFWADGVQVASGVVTVVEQRRFKIGTLNTTLSSFDDEGNTTSAIYATVEVNTPSHGSAFAPKYAYFVANNLVYGEVTPEGEAATVTGDEEGLAEQPAIIYTATVSSAWLSAWGGGQDVSLGGATITTQLTEDGVQADEAVFNFSTGATYAGAYSSLVEVAQDLTDGISGVSVAALDSDGDGADDTLVFYTTKTGSDQSFSIKTTGTNSVAANIGVSATMSGTGKDVEFADEAILTGDYLTLPLPASQSDGMILTIIDSFGTYEIDLTAATTGSANLDALGTQILGYADTDGVWSIKAFLDDGGPSVTEIATLYFVDEDGDLITAPASAASGRMVIKTRQGGSSVSVDLDQGSSGSRTDLILLGFSPDAGAVPGAGYEADVFDTAITDDGSTIVDTGDTITFNDGSTTFTFLVGASPYTSASTLVGVLNDGTDGQWSGNPSSKVQFYLIPQTATTVKLGARIIDGASSLTLGGTISAGQDFISTGVTGADVTTNTSDDSGADLLSGTRLAFMLDENPYLYEVDFTSNSLQDAIDDINDLVGGSTDIASESSDALTLTSSFAGAASAVEVDLTESTSATVLGFDSTNNDDEGAGRPNPDFYQDGEGTVYIGANILRNRSTGVPYTISSALADIYFDYVGLRLDVTSDADDAALLSFNDVDTMIAAIGPVSTDNPLALACFLQLSNAPSQSVSALGVSEVLPAAPMGTVTAYAKALNFLESKDVYALAPLTDDPFVQQLFSTHVQSMSQPEERGERIVFIWQGQPSRAADASVQSGTGGETNGTDNSVSIDGIPTSAIIAAGASDPSALTVDDGIYMELVIVDLGVTTVRNYSISSVSGARIFFRTSFASGENDDGFFSTTTLEGDSDYTGMTYAIRKRGDLLLVTGTTIPDYAAISEAAASAGESYANRRVFHVYADSADTSIDGVVTNVEGYYICAAITGMVAEQAPQQPFTRLSMTGFSYVYGTDDTFSENQLDTIADGGRYVMINQGGRIASRHQRSTASNSIEARELSITKAIDFLAKGLRATNRVYIGRFVINPGFIDQLVMSNEGFLARSVQSGVVNAASLKSVLQDESAPDTVLIEVEVAPAYPCNKIRITIVS